MIFAKKKKKKKMNGKSTLHKQNKKHTKTNT